MLFYHNLHATFIHRIDTQCKLWDNYKRAQSRLRRKVRSSGSTQGPSLAAGDSNALGIGGCAGAEPILHGSALAFLAPETPFRQKNANLPANLERCGLACVPPGENIPAALAGIYGLL